MTRFASRCFTLGTIAAALLLAPRSGSAHFVWITLEPAAEAGATTIRLFLSETPTPGGPEFLGMVRDIRPSVDGQPVPATAGEETMDSRWAGKLPRYVDAAKDLGVKSREGKDYRLYYTARAQTAPVAADASEEGDKLRARLVTVEGKPRVQVLFEGKPVAKARLKVTPEDGDPFDAVADDAGMADIAGLAEGKSALWANHVDARAGEISGKAFSETRYYATLTVFPKIRPVASSDAQAGTAPFATMTEPAVNSFGGAVLGDWLYVYSGHVGHTHEYSVNTTSRSFRRFNLKDRTTWESLPMARDVQGTALVSDGTTVYRVGGMSARNQPDQEHDLYSVADFARFDPATKKWTDLPPLPQPRSTHDAVIVGRTVYAVGGWEMKGATEKATFVDHVAAFDLDHPELGWKKIDQPFRRRALSAAEAGGKIFVLGGLTDGMKVVRRVDVFDPSAGTWSQAAELPGTGKNDGFGTSSFGVDGRIYYSGASGRIFRLDDSGQAWEAIGAWELPRITHRILPGLDHSLLAVGGNSRGQQTPVIECVPLPRPRTSPASAGE
ncbi:kelch repeat-containing protein [Tundrisphaera sp. TA3]|uniref:kelch repeat-containing protein n=1 Tax=Tundrisphaera sp. TA3 TaxID=3435775 RepID=UPI003EBD70DB